MSDNENGQIKNFEKEVDPWSLHEVPWSHRSCYWDDMHKFRTFFDYLDHGRGPDDPPSKRYDRNIPKYEYICEGYSGDKLDPYPNPNGDPTCNRGERSQFRTDKYRELHLIWWMARSLCAIKLGEVFNSAPFRVEVKHNLLFLLFSGCRLHDDGKYYQFHYRYETDVIDYDFPYKAKCIIDEISSTQRQETPDGHYVYFDYLIKDFEHQIKYRRNLEKDYIDIAAKHATKIIANGHELGNDWRNKGFNEAADSCERNIRSELMALYRYKEKKELPLDQPIKTCEAVVAEPAPEPTPTHTYIMKNKRNGLYKIGKSINPKHRESTLQSEEPNVILVWSVDKDI